ncbi:MAG: response regulator [Alphaproteobacteria bacterium]|nr:response regulator [Alphaproteobacteria bacterium]
MPKTDGIDAMEALKTIVKLDPDAKVIMVSSMGQQNVIVEAIEAGAKDYIIKPFDDKVIIDTVARITQ